MRERSAEPEAPEDTLRVFWPLAKVKSGGLTMTVVVAVAAVKLLLPE